MRADMAKVIVERPRIGSRMRGESKGYQRSLQRLGREEMPYREGMKRRHLGDRPSEARKQYGALVFATGTRRLARRELAQFPIPFEQRDDDLRLPASIVSRRDGRRIDDHRDEVDPDRPCQE